MPCCVNGSACTRGSSAAGAPTSSSSGTWFAMTLHHVLQNCFAVYGVIHRLAHAEIVERLFCRIDEMLLRVTAKPKVTRHNQLGIGPILEVVQRACRWLGDDLDTARFQLGNTRGWIRNHPQHQTPWIDLTLPVIGIG